MSHLRNTKYFKRAIIIFCQKDDALSHVEKSNVKRTGKASRKNIKNTSVYLQYHNNHHSKNNSNLADTSRMQDDDKPVIIEKVLFEEKMNVKGESLILLQLRNKVCLRIYGKKDTF